MCGECGPDRDTTMTCDSEAGVNCSLRYLYCLRPYGSLPPDVPPPPDMPDVPLLFQAPLTTADSFTFEEGFIVVGGRDNFWNRSNPFTRELQLWPVNSFDYNYAVWI